MSFHAMTWAAEEGTGSSFAAVRDLSGLIGREQLRNCQTPNGELLSWDARRIAWEVTDCPAVFVVDAESKTRLVLGTVRHGVDYTADEIWDDLIAAWPGWKKDLLLLLDHLIREDRLTFIMLDDVGTTPSARQPLRIDELFGRKPAGKFREDWFSQNKDPRRRSTANIAKGQVEVENVLSVSDFLKGPRDPPIRLDPRPQRITCGRQLGLGSQRLLSIFFQGILRGDRLYHRLRQLTLESLGCPSGFLPSLVREGSKQYRENCQCGSADCSYPSGDINGLSLLLPSIVQKSPLFHFMILHRQPLVVEGGADFSWRVARSMVGSRFLNDFFLSACSESECEDLEKP
jgi:hypothetical protein